MTDSRPSPNSDLPWLQEVEDEEGTRGISARTMFVGFVAVLLVAAAVAATFFWLGRERGQTGAAPELIRAPHKPYKVKPENPGGLDVAGESQTTFETSAGREVDGRLNLGATGSENVAVDRSSQPETMPAAEEKPAPPPPKPYAASGSVIQLGAFRNTAQAERAWTALSARFGLLSGMTKIVVPYSAAGSSGYRLRAAAPSPEAARQACETIRAGGESCFIAR